MTTNLLLKTLLTGVTLLLLSSCVNRASDPPAQANVTKEKLTLMEPSKVHSLLLRSAEKLRSAEGRGSPKLYQDLGQIYRQISVQSLHDIDALMKINRESEAAKSPFFEIALQILVSRDFSSVEKITVSQVFVRGQSRMSLDELSELVWDSRRELIILESTALNLYGNVTYYAPGWWDSVRLIVKARKE